MIRVRMGFAESVPVDKIFYTTARYHRHFAHEYFKSWGHWSADGGSDSPELIWYSRYHGTPAKTKQNPVGNPHPVIPYNVNPGHK